jgi:cytochrome c oxidase subunit 2
MGCSSTTILVAVALLAGADLQRDSFWLPPPASSTAPVVDNAFLLLLGVSAFFFALIVVLGLWFVVRYRRRAGLGPAQSPSHNTALELLWTAIPLGIVALLFYEGFVGYMELRTPPKQAYEIEVVARKWSWLFSYPNGHKDENLHVPVDRPVRLVMRSEDVIHGLFIPAMRVQMDIVPGRYTRTWFRALKPGEYNLVCSQYCGTKHFDMRALVIVHPPGEFENWLADAARAAESLSPVDRGRELYRINGCWSCHSIDGTAGTGPTFKGIYGHEVQFQDGTSAVVDENYIRESILDPQAKVVRGYQPVMNTYRGVLTDEEISALIAFIKSLQ